MPPNEKLLPTLCDESSFSFKKRQEEERAFLERFHSSYRPLLDNAARRMSIYRWLKGKRQDDNIGEDVWRVGNNLYDFTPFLSKHPGGAQWLELSKGTDITEAFNASHVFIDKAEKVLERYLVRPCAEIPRKSPYTFERDGFYSTLRTRVAKILEPVGTGPTWQIKLMADCMVVVFHLMLLCTACTGSYLVALVTGMILGITVGFGHNFHHQNDNFRRYYLDIAAFNSTDWRLLHTLSHHLFTSTYNDYEVQGIYPLVDLNAHKDKGFFHRHLSQGFAHVVFFLVPGPLSFFHKLGLVIVGDCKLSPLDLMPALHFAVVHHLSGLDAWTCFCLVVVIHGTAGYWVAFSALIATHQHPHLFHMGDGPLPSRDWGLQQMDAVRDVRGKSRSLFLAATTFGDHLLHHLFPTVDHSKLQLLYPALKETLYEFGQRYDLVHWWTMVEGLHVQLGRNYPHTYEQRRAAWEKDNKDL